jgi:hypothetical protein
MRLRPRSSVGGNYRGRLQFGCEVRARRRLHIDEKVQVFQFPSVQKPNSAWNVSRRVWPQERWCRSASRRCNTPKIGNTVRVRIHWVHRRALAVSSRSHVAAALEMSIEGDEGNLGNLGGNGQVVLFPLPTRRRGRFAMGGVSSEFGPARLVGCSSLRGRRDLGDAPLSSGQRQRRRGLESSESVTAAGVRVCRRRRRLWIEGRGAEECSQVERETAQEMTRPRRKIGRASRTW